MARLDQAIKSHLESVAGVTAVVGSGSAARIYPGVLPQSPTYPAIRFQVFGGGRESAMGSDTGDVMSTLQVDSYAKTYSAAYALAEAVRGGLQRFKGASAGVTISAVFVESGPNDIYEESVQVRRMQLDFVVWHKE